MPCASRRGKARAQPGRGGRPVKAHGMGRGRVVGGARPRPRRFLENAPAIVFRQVRIRGSSLIAPKNSSGPGACPATRRDAHEPGEDIDERVGECLPPLRPAAAPMSDPMRFRRNPGGRTREKRRDHRDGAEGPSGQGALAEAEGAYGREGTCRANLRDLVEPDSWRDQSGEAQMRRRVAALTRPRRASGRGGCSKATMKRGLSAAA